ncbi:MAG: cytochrome b5 domain-containing protein [Candidatus Paceibacterota bacterium]|jgi:nitrate reductase (NAD(P)H)
MKKAVFVALIIFFVVVITILVSGALNNKQSLSSPSQNINNTPAKQKVESSQKNTENTKTFLANEVSKHSNASDCWLIVGGKVYDVTKYLNADLHPAGSDAITPYCGQDVTQTFESTHSQKAWNILNNYYLGDLSSK